MTLDILVTMAAIATIASYLWSVKYHFESSALEVGAKFISFMVISCSIVFTLLTWMLEQNSSVQLVGLIVQIFALALFWITIRETRTANLLAVFTDKNPGSLVTTGPYKFVRHPFYSAYLLFWLGWAIATGSWVSMVLFVIMFMTYWIAASGEEQKFEDTAMADQYADFKRGRTRFIPFII